jgi:cell division protein FtsB
MVIILLILAVLFLKGVWGVYEKQRLTKENLNKVAADLKNLQEREKMLSTEIDWLKTKGGTEQEIREKYGLVKPGEEVIVIVDDEKDKAGDSQPANLGFWQKIWNWLQ